MKEEPKTVPWKWRQYDLLPFPFRKVQPKALAVDGDGHVDGGLDMAHHPRFGTLVALLRLWLALELIAPNVLSHWEPSTAGEVQLVP